MKIHQYAKDSLLYCRFRGHEFELEREDSSHWSCGGWYMIVKGDDGEIACDGWIDDSSCYTAKEAMIAACSGAMLGPPKRWPAKLWGEK